MDRNVIVLDTHALLWWALDPKHLSREATALVAKMEQEGGFASAISLWELAVKVKRGKLELPLPVQQLAERIAEGGVVEVLPVDTRTWLHSVALEWEHSDPADRVIVSTAMLRGVPLLSKESAIRSFSPVKCVW